MKTFNSVATIFTTISLLLLHNMQCDAQLSSTFYDATCAKASTLILNSIRGAISRDTRMAASLVRLNFHDCFIQGCDASILLDEAPSIQSEKVAVPNNNSIRGFDVIEAAKREVERACPGVVSYADIYGSIYVGGPSWTVRLGRRDSTTASRDQANLDLPSTFASLDVLISSFASKGLSARDMVALSDVYFHVAMPPGAVKSFYASLVEKFQKAYSVDAVKDGVFGAMMKVILVNDGPLTMQLDSGQSSK